MISAWCAVVCDTVILMCLYNVFCSSWCRWGLETCVLSRECLKTWFFMSWFWLSLDTCMSCLGSVLSFHISSCLKSHDCVLPVSLSGIARCLLCAETVAFLAESRPLGSLTHCLLTYRKKLLLWLLLFYRYNCILITVHWQYLSLRHFNSVSVSSQSNA